MLNDDLKNGEHDDGALEAQINVYKDQLQKCQDIITHLRTRNISHAKDPGKDNTVMIIEKNTIPEEDEFMSIPTILQECKHGLLPQKDDGSRHNVHIIGP